MQVSAPQLIKDIHRLQARVAELEAELAAERSKPPVVKEVVRQGQERVVYRDNPKHIAMIRKLQGRA